MKIKRYNYSKALVFFSMLILLVLITGCNGGAPPIGELYGAIDVNSTPSGANVYLDGEDTGQVTPIILPNITVGDHIIELRKFHYQGWEGVVTVMLGQTVYLNPPLLWAPLETITLQPGTDGKDAYVFEYLPTWNYNLANLTVELDSFGQSARSYLQFNLSSVPPEAVILEAKLGLYYYYTDGLTSLLIGLYEVTESWEEDTIAWDNRPASSNVEEAVLNISTIPTNDFVYWYIYDLVKGWHNGSITNYGMLLRAIDESSNDGNVLFWSSDDGMGIKRPKLVIDYYIP